MPIELAFNNRGFVFRFKWKLFDWYQSVHCVKDLMGFDKVYVIPNIRWHPNGGATSRNDAILFEEFIVGVTGFIPVEPEKPKRDDVGERKALEDKFPWYRHRQHAKGFKNVPAPSKKDKRKAPTAYDSDTESTDSDSESSEKGDPEIDEGKYEKEWNQFQNRWQTWIDKHKDVIPKAFIIDPRRGQFTFTHAGIVADGIRARPREAAKDCQIFFKRYYPVGTRSVTLSIRLYKELWCNRLALAWARRQDHFFKIWLAAPDKHMSFTQQNRDDYKPDVELTNLFDALPADSIVRERAVAIEESGPWAPIA